MKAWQAFQLLKSMDPEGQLYVKGPDGKLVAVSSIVSAGVNDIYMPTTMVLSGVRYVREDSIDKVGA